jgi:hypothetical protein
MGIKHLLIPFDGHLEIVQIQLLPLPLKVSITTHIANILYLINELWEIFICLWVFDAPNNKSYPKTGSRWFQKPTSDLGIMKIWNTTWLFPDQLNLCVLAIILFVGNFEYKGHKEIQLQHTLTKHKPYSVSRYLNVQGSRYCQKKLL